MSKKMAELTDRIFVSGMTEECGVEVWLEPDEGGTEYLKAEAVRDALPDQIEIYRAIKKAGVRKHGDIAQVIADLYTLEEQSDAS